MRRVNYQSSEYINSYQSRKDISGGSFTFEHRKQPDWEKIKIMETGNVFSLYPSIGGSFSFGWRKMFEKSFLTLLVVVIIAGILSGPADATLKMDNFDHNNIFDISFGIGMIFLFMIGLAWKFLVQPVISYGERMIFLEAMRDKTVDIKMLFYGFRNQYVDIILARLIVFALVAIGFVMLIIPGIIIACRLAFVPFIVMDQKLEPMAAIEKSWQMTRGHGWKIFFMAITSFFLIIGGLIAMIVGIFISILWIHAAFASLYQAVLNQDLRNNTIPIIDTVSE